MSAVENWENNWNLLLNSKKTKQMVVSTQPLSRANNLGSYIPSVTVTGKNLERVPSFKLLGTHISENLKWDEQTKQTISSCYGVLSILLKLKNLAPFHVKKQLAESVVLSKIDYNDVVHYPLPACLNNTLQPLQNVAASFVYNRYCREVDVLSLGWLPQTERIQYHLRIAHKAIWALIFILRIRFPPGSSITSNL